MGTKLFGKISVMEWFMDKCDLNSLKVWMKMGWKLDENHTIWDEYSIGHIIFFYINKIPQTIVLVKLIYLHYYQSSVSYC